MSRLSPVRVPLEGAAGRSRSSKEVLDVARLIARRLVCVLPAQTPGPTGPRAAGRRRRRSQVGDEGLEPRPVRRAGGVLRGMALWGLGSMAYAKKKQNFGGVNEGQADLGAGARRGGRHDRGARPLRVLRGLTCCVGSTPTSGRRRRCRDRRAGGVGHVAGSRQRRRRPRRPRRRRRSTVDDGADVGGGRRLDDDASPRVGAAAADDRLAARAAGRPGRSERVPAASATRPARARSAVDYLSTVKQRSLYLAPARRSRELLDGVGCVRRRRPRRAGRRRWRGSGSCVTR